MGDFEKSVFINCPFDDDYRQILLAIVFAIKFLGFIPKLSLLNSDSGTTRLTKIVELIETSKFGIHDISRMTAKNKGDHARMNMPFELGIDYGCKKFKGRKCADKKILVLEEKKYSYQKALSDISGSDINHHNNEPMEALQAVRNWFVTEELGTGPSGTTIWYDFNEFTSDLEEKLQQEGHRSEDFGRVLITEVMVYMDRWFADRR